MDIGVNLAESGYNIYEGAKNGSGLQVGLGAFGLGVNTAAIGKSLRRASGGATSSVAGAVGKRTPADVLAANRAAGRAAEATAAKQLVQEGSTILGSRVSARTSQGRRVIDHLIQTPQGRIFAIEVKSGIAVRNASQLAKDAILGSKGGVLVGKIFPAANLRNSGSSGGGVVRCADRRAVNKAGDGVRRWLGEGSVVKRADQRGLVIQSRDGLRQFRMDLQGHGKWPPHAHLQVFEPTRERFVDAPGVPHHLYFKDVPRP